MSDIIHLTEADAGVYVSASFGDHAIARMVIVANSFGYGWDDDTQQANVDLAQRQFNTLTSPTDTALTDADLSTLSDAATSAEEWLNETIVPEGFSFSWNEAGQFVMGPTPAPPTPPPASLKAVKESKEEVESSS